MKRRLSNTIVAAAVELALLLATGCTPEEQDAFNRGLRLFQTIEQAAEHQPPPAPPPGYLPPSFIPGAHTNSLRAHGTGRTDETARLLVELLRSRK